MGMMGGSSMNGEDDYDQNVFGQDPDSKENAGKFQSRFPPLPRDHLLAAR